MKKSVLSKSRGSGFSFHKILLPSALLMAAAIFAIDTQIQLGVAIGALHIIPVLMVVPLESRKWSLWVASICTILIVIKLLFWPMGEAIPWMVFTNRAISLLVVWVTVLLGLYIFRSKRKLREMGSFLTVCAWTKQVKVGDRWISFDQYLSENLGIKITHGINEDTAKKMLQELKIEVKET